jgi:transcription factor C subunit 7
MVFGFEGLSEWYSPILPNTGLHPRPGSAASLKTYFPEIDAESWSSVYYPSRRGENVDALLDRAAGLLRDLVPEVERKFEGRHRNIVLFSHAATIIALDKELLGDRSQSVRVGCCTLSEFDREGEGWKVVKLAEGGHLAEGVQREWGFEDILFSNGDVRILWTVQVEWAKLIASVIQVIEDSGEKGAEEEDDEPVGSQINRREANL